MKNITKFFAIAIAILGFSAASFAQSSATATATATLITPISITKTTDMNFGTVAASATAGSVTLDYNDVATPSGGTTLVAGGAARKAAEFQVTGQNSSSFSISCPTSIVLTSGANTLTVNAISPDSGSTSNLSASGSKTIKVQGTLVVPAGALAGVYTNTADLEVTVNYN
jgi:hypothetical protein